MNRPDSSAFATSLDRLLAARVNPKKAELLLSAAEAAGLDLVAWTDHFLKLRTAVQP